MNRTTTTSSRTTHHINQSTVSQDDGTNKRNDNNEASGSAGDFLESWHTAISSLLDTMACCSSNYYSESQVRDEVTTELRSYVDDEQCRIEPNNIANDNQDKDLYHHQRRRGNSNDDYYGEEGGFLFQDRVVPEVPSSTKKNRHACNQTSQQQKYQQLHPRSPVPSTSTATTVSMGSFSCSSSLPSSSIPQNPSFSDHCFPPVTRCKSMMDESIRSKNSHLFSLDGAATSTAVGSSIATVHHDNRTYRHRVSGSSSINNNNPKTAPDIVSNRRSPSPLSRRPLEIITTL